MTESASVFQGQTRDPETGVGGGSSKGSDSDNPLQEKNLNLKCILLTSRQVLYAVYIGGFFF